MNPITERFIADFAGILTTVLIHFVWQGAILSLALVLVVKLFDVRSAQHRYLLSVGTLLLMGVAPFFTAYSSLNSKLVPQNSVGVAPDHSKAVIETRSDVLVVEQSATVNADDIGRNQPAISSPHRNGKIEFYVLILWLAGVLVLSTRLAIGFGITLWIRRNLRPLSEQFEQRVLLLGDRLRVNARQRVFTCMRVGQAVAVGFIRPVVLIPVAWLTQLTPEMLEAVIAHELAHIRRWDLWVNLVQRVIETLLFYHPAVWWVSNRIRLEREMCCDEMAAGCLDRAVYARSLESVARIAHGSLLMAASINGGNKMNLLRRIRYLLGVAPAEAAGNWAVGFVGLILPFAAMIAFSLSTGSTPSVARADDNAEESKAVEKIELLGGKVTRDDNLPGRPVIGIDLQGSKKINDKYMHLLASFKSLTTLNLTDNVENITDASLVEIGKLKTLTTLNLSNCRSITDAGLGELKGLEHLTTLKLTYSSITEAGLKEISGLTNLTTLDLWGIKISDDGLKAIGKLENLTAFNFHGNSPGITDAGMKELKRLKRLTTLNLLATKVTDAGLMEISRLTNLTTLQLSYCPQITDAGMKEITSFTSLTRLDLGRTGITDVGLKEIRRFKNLTRLDLGGTGITDVGLKEIKELKNLTELYLYNTDITDEGLKEISDLNNLTVVSLSQTKITDVGLKHLGGLTNLKTLGLSSTGVTDVGMKEITGLTHLTRLDLGGTGITDVGLKEITRFINLTKLRLGQTQVTDDGMKEISELKHLKTLAVSGTQVTAVGVKELKNSFPNLDIER